MTEQNYRIRIKQDAIEIEIEGDKEFVERHIEEFTKGLPRIAEKLPPKEAPESPKVEALEGLSLAEFYKQKQPKEDMEVALTIAYYLTSTEKKEEFTNGEVTEEADKLGAKLSNTAYTLKDAAKGKKAFVRKISKGKWALTIEGRNFVENGLPKKTEK